MAKKDKKNWFQRQLNKTGLFINKVNPASTQNKRIRDKQRIVDDEKSTRQQKSVAKVQKAALIRKRDDIKIKDVHAKNKTSMQKRAKQKNTDYQSYKKGNMSREAFIKKYPNSNLAKKYAKKKPRKKNYNKEPLGSRINDAWFKDI